MTELFGLSAFGASASGDQAPSQGASGAQCVDKTQIPALGADHMGGGLGTTPCSTLGPFGTVHQGAFGAQGGEDMT